MIIYNRDNKEYWTVVEMIEDGSGSVVLDLIRGRFALIKTKNIIWDSEFKRRVPEDIKKLFQDKLNDPFLEIFSKKVLNSTSLITSVDV